MRKILNYILENSKTLFLVANDSEKIWAFVLLKSETQVGLGRIMSNEYGTNTTSFIQAMIDFGIHCTLTVKDIFGRHMDDDIG